MSKDYDITSLVNDINFSDNMLNNYNGLLLTNAEVAILNRYNIDYQNCFNLNELLYKIESILYDENIEELDQISSSIAERNYYQNTNK